MWIYSITVIFLSSAKLFSATAALVRSTGQEITSTRTPNPTKSSFPAKHNPGVSVYVGVSLIPRTSGAYGQEFENCPVVGIRAASATNSYVLDCCLCPYPHHAHTHWISCKKWHGLGSVLCHYGRVISTLQLLQWVWSDATYLALVFELPRRPRPYTANTGKMLSGTGSGFYRSHRVIASWISTYVLLALPLGK